MSGAFRELAVRGREVFVSDEEGRIFAVENHALREIAKSGDPWLTDLYATETSLLWTSQPYRGAAGWRREIHAIETRTIADCVVAITEDPSRFDRQVFELTGPEALNGEEVAGALGRIIEREVKFVSPPISQYRERLEKRELPDWQIASLCEMYEALQAGRAPHLARVTSDVERITGKPARPFLEAAAYLLLI